MATQGRTRLHGAVRFAFWVIPCILWMRHQMAVPPVSADAVPPGAAGKIASVSMDTLLPVPPGFEPVAKIAQIRYESVSRTYQNQPYRRRIVFLTVPRGLSRREVDDNLRAVARNMYESGVMAFILVAYNEGEHAKVGRNPVGSLSFAPRGDFAQTNEVYDISDYEVAVRHPEPIRRL